MVCVSIRDSLHTHTCTCYQRTHTVLVIVYLFYVPRTFVLSCFVFQGKVSLWTVLAVLELTFVDWTGLELIEICRLLPPKCWESKCAPLPTCWGTPVPPDSTFQLLGQQSDPWSSCLCFPRAGTCVSLNASCSRAECEADRKMVTAACPSLMLHQHPKLQGVHGTQLNNRKS